MKLRGNVSCSESPRERINGEEKRRRERGGGTERERMRETGCSFVVDLFRCRRGFPFLCIHASLFRYFAQFPAPENWKTSRRSPSTPSPFIYICKNYEPCGVDIPSMAITSIVHDIFWKKRIRRIKSVDS